MRVVPSVSGSDAAAIGAAVVVLQSELARLDFAGSPARRADDRDAVIAPPEESHQR